MVTALAGLEFRLVGHVTGALGGYRIEDSTREAFYQRKRVTAEKLSLENRPGKGRCRNFRRWPF